MQAVRVWVSLKRTLEFSSNYGSLIGQLVTVRRPKIIGTETACSGKEGKTFLCTFINCNFVFKDCDA